MVLKSFDWCTLIRGKMHTNGVSSTPSKLQTKWVCKIKTLCFFKNNAYRNRNIINYELQTSWSLSSEDVQVTPLVCILPLMTVSCTPSKLQTKWVLKFMLFWNLVVSFVTVQLGWYILYIGRKISGRLLYLFISICPIKGHRFVSLSELLYILSNTIWTFLLSSN